MTNQNNLPYHFGDQDPTPYMSDLDMLQASGASGADYLAWAKSRVAARKERELLGTKHPDVVRIIEKYFDGDEAAYDRAHQKRIQECLLQSLINFEEDEEE